MRLPRSTRPVDEYTAERARARLARLNRAGRYAAGPAEDELAGPPVASGPGRRRRAPVTGERVEVGLPDDEVAARAERPRAELRRDGSPRLDSLRDRLPVSLRCARLGLERRHVAVVALALLLGLCSAGLFFGLGRPGVVPVDHEVVTTGTPVGSSAAAASGLPTGGRADDGSASGGDPAGRMMVHVAGLVAKPGVVDLPVGSRIIDAIDAAGGPTDDADLTPLNLARILNDGEQVLVTAEPPAGPPGSPVGDEPGGPVSLNTATAADLETLPGIGPALAERILDWRRQNSRFSSIDELREVSGIGEQRFAELEPRVTL